METMRAACEPPHNPAPKKAGDYEVAHRLLAIQPLRLG